MKTVFLFSDYFNIQMLSYGLDYILNFEIDKIVLLEENHKKSPLIWHEYPLTVTVLKTIDQCVISSDIIIAYKNANISDKTLNYLLRIAQEKGKLLYLIDTPNFRMDAILQSSPINSMKVASDDNYKKGASILIMNIGTLSLSYDIEVLLARVLTDFEISFKQSFLESTNSILHQYQQCEILNRRYFDMDKNAATTENDISVISIDIGHNIEDIVKHAVSILELYVDYIIVIADGSYIDKSQKVINYVKYCRNKAVDMIIFSPFRIIDKQYLIKCTDNHFLCDRSFYITDPKLDAYLKNDLLRKLSFPQGIELYN